jgi:hypothetical protein
MDAAVVPHLRRQRCGLQLHVLAYNAWQLHADAGDARGDGALVADEPAREADQDRRQSVSRGRYATFQMAEVAVSRQMFQEILSLIARLRASPALVFRSSQMIQFTRQSAAQRAVSSRSDVNHLFASEH